MEIKLLLFVVSSEDGDALVVMEQEKKKICFLMKGTTKGERRLGQARCVQFPKVSCLIGYPSLFIIPDIVRKSLGLTRQRFSNLDGPVQVLS